MSAWWSVRVKLVLKIPLPHLNHLCGNILVLPVEIRNGKRVTDKTDTICKHCKKTMPYTAANTSTMQKHIQNHHSSLLKPAAQVTKTLKGQTTLNAVVSLPPSSARATAITRDICVFIAADMRPFSVVENLGFRRLLHILIYLYFFFMFDLWQGVTFLMWNRTGEKPVSRVYSKTFCTVCMSFTA